VKSRYNSLKLEEQVEEGALFVRFWKLKTLPSTNVTTWRVLHNKIATKETLLRRGNLCIMCGEEEETINNIFFKCKVTNMGFVFCVAGSIIGQPLWGKDAFRDV